MGREKKSVLVSVALYSGAAAACRPTTSLLCTACIGVLRCVVEDKGPYVVCVCGTTIVVSAGDGLTALCISDAGRVNRVGWGHWWNGLCLMRSIVREMLLLCRNVGMLMSTGCATVEGVLSPVDNMESTVHRKVMLQCLENSWKGRGSLLLLSMLDLGGVWVPVWVPKTYLP